MIYRCLADAVVALHLLFIVYALLGGLLGLWRKWAVALHLPAALWAVGIELTGGLCPLTPLENRLRTLAGEAGYPGGFIEHYLLPIIYPPGLTHDVQIALGLGALLANLAIYAWIIQHWRKIRT